MFYPFVSPIKILHQNKYKSNALSTNAFASMSKKVEVPQDEYDCIMAMLDTHLSLHRDRLLVVFAKVVASKVRKIIFENVALGDWCDECVKNDHEYQSGRHMCRKSTTAVFTALTTKIRQKLDKEDVMEEFRQRIAKEDVHRRSLASFVGRTFDEIFSDATAEIVTVLATRYKGPVKDFIGFSGFGDDMYDADFSCESDDY